CRDLGLLVLDSEAGTGTSFKSGIYHLKKNDIFHFIRCALISKVTNLFFLCLPKRNPSAIIPKLRARSSVG
ncbi:MAG: hypothetical protein ABSA23_17725, partial [Anaerolineales bacterium]